MADDLSSELDRIAERREHMRARYGNVGGLLALAGAKDDMPRVLAALRVVLELHQPVDRGAGVQCKGCATHITSTWWPCKTYLAITREITGQPEEKK